MFQILNRKINGKSLVYLDNAATSQKPQEVVDAIVGYYENHNANVHRGIHTLSEEASEMFENARKNVASFIGAPHTEEVIFTKGTTDSINAIALTWAVQVLKPGDVILTTDMEHHSNLVPWQVAAQKTGAILKALSIDEEGAFPMDAYKAALKEHVKIVAVTQASNVMGTILPVKEISKLAHEAGAKAVIDGAQANPHLAVNVSSLGCDFYAFSGHKMLGPTGIGVLWGRKELLEQMDPYEYGGGMIDTVSATQSTWAPLPAKLEAGTPNICGAVGLSAAINYLKNIGMEKVRQHEIEITEYALAKLDKIEGIRILGPKNANERTGLVSFTIDKIHSHDLASVLNTEGIAVRSGHHCCMPLHKKFNIPSTTRVSFYIYNTKEDVDRLIEGIEKALKIFI